MIYRWISDLTWKIPFKKEASWRFSVQLLLVRGPVSKPEIPFTLDHTSQLSSSWTELIWSWITCIRSEVPLFGGRTPVMEKKTDRHIDIMFRTILTISWIKNRPNTLWCKITGFVQILPIHAPDPIFSPKLFPTLPSTQQCIMKSAARCRSALPRRKSWEQWKTSIFGDWKKITKTSAVG